MCSAVTTQGSIQISLEEAIGERSSCVSKVWSGGRRLILSMWQVGNMCICTPLPTSELTWSDFLSWGAPTPSLVAGKRFSLVQVLQGITFSPNHTCFQQSESTAVLLHSPLHTCMRDSWDRAVSLQAGGGRGGNVFHGVSIMLFRQLPLPSSLTVEEPDKIQVWERLWQFSAAYWLSWHLCQQ